jgi:hypothetical protein
MRKFIVNPVTNQYESTAYKPTHSNLMKSIGRPDVAKALDKNKKKLTGFNNKNVGALDVASAQGRDILSEQLMYKWDSSSGKFFNGSGKSVDTMAEANKLNDETALFAPGNEGKQFEEQFIKDKQTALKGFYPRVHDKEFQNTLRKVQGKKKKLNDIDLLFSAADPKEKMEMRKNYKTYDFSKRKFKEDIAKEEILKTPISSSPPVPPKPVEVPSVDVRELIKQRANSRAATERAQSVKEYGAHGLGHLRLQMRGLDD